MDPLKKSLTLDNNSILNVYPSEQYGTKFRELEIRHKT